MTPGQNVVTEILKKMPSISTRSLARLAYKEHPECFASIAAARNVARRIRGELASCISTENIIPRETPGVGGNPFPALPQPLKHFNAWAALKIEGAQRILVLSDIHAPYYDQSALVAALEYGQQFKPTIALLNGDIADFFSVSHWQKDPRKRNFAKEIEGVRSIVDTIRSAFPSARLIYKLGNHEERLESYMFTRAPELLGLPEFSYESLFRLKPEELVRDMRPIQAGDLNIIHGHEYRFSISNPVNPARGFFLRCKAYALGSHFHQTSSHSARAINGKSLGAWSIGCLCDLHPDYRPLNDWNHGFATVEVFEDGKFHVENKFISKGRVY